MSIDALVDSALEQKVRAQLPALVEREVAARLGKTSPWMTEKELADYWQVSVDSIRNWSKREDHPLPYGNVGEMRRYHRDDVDQWAREEAQRRRDQKKSSNNLEGADEL